MSEQPPVLDYRKPLPRPQRPTNADLFSLACFLFSAVTVFTLFRGLNVVLFTGVGLISGIVAVAKAHRNALPWIALALNCAMAGFIYLMFLL